MRFAWAFPLLLAACSREDAPPPNIGQLKSDIREIIEKYHAAGDQGDVEVMASFLAPEVSMFKGGGEFARGKEACVKELTDRVKMFEGQKRKTVTGSPEVSVTGDMAVATYVAFVMVGTETKSAPITAVFRRSQGKWYIAHLHESWPTNK
jgi:uncharacterized protein (TIGR02246 family)